MYSIGSFNAWQNFWTVVSIEINSRCESNSRRALLTAGSVGKLLTYKNAARKIVNFLLGSHCNSIILSLEIVKQKEYGR